MTEVERIIVKSLRYNFTDAELKVLSRELADKYQQAEQAERNKKAVAHALKSEQETLASEASKIARQIRDEYEYREVRCRVVYNNPTDGRKSAYRCDNGELVETLQMEDWELQQALPFEPAPAEATAEQQGVAEETKPNGHVNGEAKVVATDTEHAPVNGHAAEAENATLASAREAAGGTHAKNRQQKQRAASVAN